MKIKFIYAATAAIIAVWGQPSSAREAVALPGVVGVEGQLNGVDTTGAGTLSVGNNQNINTNNDLGGAITSSAANTGTVVFAGNSTLSGFTGTIGSQFLHIDAGAAGTAVNFNGSVFAATFNVTGTGTVNFNDDVTAATLFAQDGFINLGANRTLTGAITTNTAGTGTLTLNGGSSVVGAIGGASGIKRINLVGGNASVTGAVQTAGFSLGTNTLNINGALTTNAGATIATTILSNSAFGRVIVTGNSAINAAGITVTPTVTGVVTQGTNFRIVDAPAGTINAPVSVVNNNPRFLFSGVPTTTGDVNILLTTVVPLAALVTTPVAAVIAPILDVTAAPGSDLLVIQDAIAMLPNADAINNAVAQLAPGATNLAAPWVAGQATRLFQDLWMAHIDEIQNHCCDVCEPSGSADANKEHQCKTPNQHSGWWGRAFTNRGDQGNVHDMNGYDTRSYGLMIAYDVPLTDQTRVGFGGAYANTTVDGNNSSGHTEIDSYQATAYLDHIMGAAFIRGALTAGIDRYDGSRSIVFPGINRVANASFDGQQYTAMVTAGRHFSLGQTTITPLVSLLASRIQVDSFSERGAGDVNLLVDSQNYNFLQSSLGVKVERVFQSGNHTYSPEVYARWLHDFESTTMQQNVAFTGGGGKFAVDGIKQDRELFNIGAGFTFLSCNCDEQSWSVKGIYDYRWNQSKYDSHQASVMASFKF